MCLQDLDKEIKGFEKVCFFAFIKLRDKLRDKRCMHLIRMLTSQLTGRAAASFELPRATWSRPNPGEVSIYFYSFSTFGSRK